MDDYNVSGTLNIVIRHVRFLFPFVIILPNTRVKHLLKQSTIQ